MHTVLAAYYPESNGMEERTISSLKSNLVKIGMDDRMSVVSCLGMKVASIRMVPSRATGFLPFKLLYGREGLVPDEISHVKFSTEEDYNLAVENYIEQLVGNHNQAMSSDRNYHEKIKLAFDKKKVGKHLVTNFILGDHVWMDIQWYVKTKGKGGVKWIVPCLITLVHLGLLFDVSYRIETSELSYHCVSPQFLKVYNGKST